jgi:leader peptidase (prepilin peptidase)/N-methyltransferase
MAALFVVATFIDFEHFIIPDEITIGGTVAGVLLSCAIPLMQDQSSNVASGLWSLVGAVAGFGALWLVTRLGKMAFGKKRLTFEKSAPLAWVRRGEEADFTVGEDKMLWSDFFYRGNEQLFLHCEWIEIDGKRFENATVRCECDWLHLDARKWELVKVDEIKGEVTEVTLPREAMGFGDVKFIACIGAFLGWKAVAFTIMSASTIGAVVGLLTLLVGRREWSTKIPFGPYLALGGFIWLFAGPELIEWYWRFTVQPGG